MTYIKSISFEVQKDRRFPFNIDAFSSSFNLELAPLTIMVGQNGTGKSSLLKTLAVKLDCESIGGAIEQKYSFEAARILAPFLSVNFVRLPSYRFFFNPEDFHEYASKPQRYRNTLFTEMQKEREELGDSVFNQLADSMNLPLQNMKRRYGNNLLSFSHGESTMQILGSRIHSQGILIIDEPELGLHPMSIFALNALMRKMLDSGTCQFLLSTHSPIIAGIPGALIYEISSNGIHPVQYKSTALYKLIKDFMDDPSSHPSSDFHPD
jgi:predicted ATPase